MKKRTVLQKIFCVFKPRRNDILTEAESIINNYICQCEYDEPPTKRSYLGIINMIMNTAIILLTVVLSFMLYLV